MIRNANELTPAEKATFEKILGRSIRESESISIHAFEEPKMTLEQKQQIARELERYFEEVDKAALPVREQEYEDAYTEAMRCVRPSYRRHS
ncbi:MAG: hypothetical protein FJW36_21790 [Acidobacteria bacterium]|nr:hypothetical protein [Acidobacteriota bacterium]